MLDQRCPFLFVYILIPHARPCRKSLICLKNTRSVEYGCSNVAKLFEKIYIFLRKKISMIFTKTSFFSIKIFFFFQIKLCIQSKYLYPLSKNLILLKKKIHFVKIFILFKQTHSVKDESYFQFSFATNKQV